MHKAQVSTFPKLLQIADVDLHIMTLVNTNLNFSSAVSHSRNETSSEAGEATKKQVGLLISWLTSCRI